jgi:hypothetical protein
LRLYRHSFTLGPALSDHSQTPLQYPVQRDALQQQTRLMVTARGGINLNSSVSDVTASTGPELAVQTYDEV